MPHHYTPHIMPSLIYLPLDIPSLTPHPLPPISSAFLGYLWTTFFCIFIFTYNSMCINYFYH
jgi:hypothetical protein